MRHRIRERAKYCCKIFNWMTKWVSSNHFTCPMLAPIMAQAYTYIALLSQLTGPRNASHIEAMCIIHLKILLNNGTLGLPLAIDGRKKIFGIDLIF